VLEPGRELSAFPAASRARTAAAFLDSMAARYHAPAQNMLVADRAGTIGIRSTGRYPLRAGDGSGLVIRDGSRSDTDWRGALPVASYPQALAPAQGYLASANQQPVDPAQAAAYVGGDYDPWRALHINRILRGATAVTPDSMRRWQTDPGSARADLFVPRFLAAAARPAAPGVDAAALHEAARLLGEWDRRYTRENTRAVLFEAAMRQLVDRTWDELLDTDTVPVTSGARRGARREGAAPARRVATPSSAVLTRLLADSTSPWWDDRRTPATETRDAVLQQALVAALAGTRTQRGAPDDARWQWSRARHANIHHVLRLPQFSALELPVQGGPSTLSPSSGSGTHGASWRMVVELGPEVRAWGTYPGGQSGDPLSPRYKDRLPLWLEGRLDSLRVPRTPEELAGGAATLTLTPGR
jgi:penicillin amidase